MKIVATGLGFLLLLGAVPVFAQSGSVDERLRRVEQLLDGGTLVRMLSRMEELQKELQTLRGEVELQTHELEGIRRRQRELYLDIDRRLHRFEAQGGAPVVAPSTTPPAPASAGGGAPMPAPAGLSTANSGEQQAYKQSFNLLKEGRYAEARDAFQRFLASYPSGTYAGNAQYWLGEASYVTRNFDAALSEFRKVIDAYPASTKVPDSLLKIGYIHYENEAWADARKVLTELSSKYPDATAGRLAKKRLQRMKQEGH